MTREEAIQILRTQYPHDAVIKEALGLLIPELRESEDERIRRELIEYLRGDLDDITTDDTDRWIAWIEKQKEQKPAWSEEDERRIDAICELLENTSAIHPNYSHRKLIIWLKSLRPVSKESLQPHWKPSEEQMEALKTAKRWYSDNMGCNLILESLFEQLEKQM